MEDSQAIVWHGVSHVTSELSKLLIDGASGGGHRGSGWVIDKIIPETVVLTTGAMISNEDVVWVGEPEAGGSGVSVQEGEGRLSVDDKVVLNSILCLDTILDEDGVALAVVVNVPDDSEIFDSVESGSSIVRVKEDVVHDLSLIHI